MKEKLQDSLSVFGVILYYLIKIVVCVMPFIMIGTSFLWTFIFLCINSFIPSSSIVFWIWGLVSAINGTQDFWAYLYYVLFGIVFMPFFVSTILDLFVKKG